MSHPIEKESLAEEWFQDHEFNQTGADVYEKNIRTSLLKKYNQGIFSSVGDLMESFKGKLPSSPSEFAEMLKVAETYDDAILDILVEQGINGGVRFLNTLRTYAEIKTGRDFGFNTDDRQVLSDQQLRLEELLRSLSNYSKSIEYSINEGAYFEEMLDSSVGLGYYTPADINILKKSFALSI